MVHEHARQIIADGPVYDHGSGRGIHPAGETADGPGVSDLLPYRLDRVVDDVDWRPLRPALARLEEEVLEDLQPVVRVADLGVELHPEAPLLALLEGDDRDGGRLGGDLEALGGGEDGVAVARPGLLLVRGAREEAVVAPHDYVRAAVLPDLDGSHLPAEEERHELHPVADAEHRHVEVEERGVHPRGVVLVDAAGATGEDYALRVAGLYLLYGGVVGDQLRVDAGLADPAGDQLGVLAAEVQDQYHYPPIPTRWSRCSSLPSVFREGAYITSAFWNSLMFW